MHDDTQASEIQHFIVKFSPSVCVAVVASLTGEMAARSFAYHVDGTADTVTNPAVIRGLCAMTSAVHARSGSPPDDKSLEGRVTAYYTTMGE